MKLNEGFLNSMQDAMTLLRTSGPLEATEAIQRALNGGAPSSTPRESVVAEFLQPGEIVARRGFFKTAEAFGVTGDGL